MKIKEFLRRKERNTTFLGICPMTNEIVKAAILEAKEVGFAPMFVATPRQVDADRGYTGWSQGDLVEFVEDTSREIGYCGDYLIARDHGGPYQSFRDRGKPGVDKSKSMEFARELFFEDLRAGFDIIHVDATEDPRVEGKLGLKEIADRTVELITDLEDFISREGLTNVIYEIGTEEIVGGMTDPGNFEEFIKLVKGKLCDQEIEKKIIFVVGQVGTTMRIDMKNSFDETQASRLVEISSKNNLFLKVHYTDWLDDRTLERFPEIGIGAANVGPEFATALIGALLELEEKEKRAVSDSKKEGNYSNFFQTLQKATIEVAPWRKFIPDEVDGKEPTEFSRQNRKNITLCVGRYALSETEVRSARSRLYDNLNRFTDIEDIEGYLVDRIREKIRRYGEAFDLGAQNS